MTTKELKEKYLKFFEKKGHKVIAGSSLIPENDPTALFISAGMHPLVPYVLGEKHPAGKKLVNNQKCIRTNDIEEVGDAAHLTFFEMLGNWSLGDYWKKEAIEYSFEFLTKELGIPIERLAVSCFVGDPSSASGQVPKDEESAKIWQSLGIPKERIYFFGKEDNWWGPAGKTGPCGPDTEMFYWVGKGKPGRLTDSKSKGDWIEIWNDVFMEYEKKYNEKIRAILVDGIKCLIDEDYQLNQELATLLLGHNTEVIVVTNAKFNKVKVALGDIDFDIFTLEHKIEKNNPKYFNELLKKFKLNKDEVIYIEHKQESLDSAKKVGIISHLYRDHESVEEFIDNNLYYFTELKQKNVDTGMGVERTAAVLSDKKSVYDIEPLKSIVEKVRELASKKDVKMERVITDHIRAAVFILADGIIPSNLEQGYVMRRLIRLAVDFGRELGIEGVFTFKIAEVVIEKMGDEYPELKKNKDFITEQLTQEEERYSKITTSTSKAVTKTLSSKGYVSTTTTPPPIMPSDEEIGEELFGLRTTHGIPLRLAIEDLEKRGIKVNERAKKVYTEKMKEHQEKSRTATAGRFKSGLADHSEEVTKLHTVTHLLLAALRKVLGEHVIQRGSNITAERLRLDFSHSEKLTDEQLKKVEDLVNEQIKKDLSVSCCEVSLDEAKKMKAMGVFESKYGDKVKVYTVGDSKKPFSCEICGGPHVQSTSQLGHFKIKKEEASSAGIRRIRAVLK